VDYKPPIHFKCLIIIILAPVFIFCRQKTYDHIEHVNSSYTPWFTGSILPPSAINAQPGHPVLAPYVGATLTYGSYDNDWHCKETDNMWSITPYVECLFGITDHIGVDLYTSFTSNFKKGQHSTHLQDTIVLLGFQVAHDTPKSWIPDIRITFQETFPTGNYQKLNPLKLGTDSTGQGSFQSGFNLIVQKLFPLKTHFLLFKWTIGYLFPAPVHVKNLNTYGGGPGTSGKVSPGQTLMMYFSGEYSITQKWVLTFDIFFNHQGESMFSGNPGITSNEESNIVGLPCLEQITLAPQVEYNLSSNSGLLFGLWATAFGKNSPAFATALAAYYIAF